MKGDRTEADIRKLKAELAELVDARQQQRTKMRNERAEWTKERERLLASHPRELEQRLQEAMSVTREMLGEMERMAAMLRSWNEPEGDDGGK